MRKNFTLVLAFVVAGLLGSATAQAQVFNNGNFSTGATTISGVAAPTGTTWSEVSNDTGVTTDANSSAGFSASKSGGSSLADDFTVPAGQSWSVSNFAFYPYLSGYTGTTSPFTELYVRVWRGAPNLTTSTIVYGDLTTNRIATASSASTATYRIFNTVAGSPVTPGTTRLIWKIQAPVAPALVLNPGTYWVEWASNSNSTTLSHFYVPVTIAGARQTPKANAMQYITSWAAVTDAGFGTTSVTMDFPFQVSYSVVLATVSAANTGPALRVGPVPTADNVQVEFTEPRGASELTLSDIQGRQVWSGKAAAHSTSAAVPMAGLASGVYTLSITSAEGVNRVRVVKD